MSETTDPHQTSLLVPVIAVSPSGHVYMISTEGGFDSYFVQGEASPCTEVLSLIVKSTLACVPAWFEL